jgi:hypothetical protein
MMIQHGVLGHVAVHHELGMTMIFALVNVLRRGHWQQAHSQAEHARDNAGHPHTCIVCDVGLVRQTSGVSIKRACSGAFITT